MAFFLLALFVSSATSAGNPIIATSKVCSNLSLPITVTTTNYIWGLPQFSDESGVVAYNTAYNRRDFLTTFDPVSGVENSTATYKISGTFCEPAKGSASTVLLATHGLSYDRYYWDSPYQPANYSFVDYATAKGYAVFYYDRLGAGQSSKPSGYITQASIQLAILEQLVGLIRKGAIAIPSAGASGSAAKKVVLVGHSYGSLLSHSLLATYPDIVDGAILTGYGFSSGLGNAFGLTLASAQPRIATSVNPVRFKDYDSGYVAPVDIYAITQVFYKVGLFDPAAAQYFWDHSSPLAIMEFSTLGLLNYNSSSVTTPVFIFTGDEDYIFCGGNCDGVLEPVASIVFSSSVGFETYAQPGSGHCLNQHYNATGGFGVITDYLVRNGL